ncbi:unnamed protein product [Allacma fusca]|uniref:Uncharacterized protein n=1 Tax=Allacma fusca TaxID=39272 RepID=A0A8J2KDY8_9HEXA|nr:unnamed protein product [Allacma fusca]
MWPSATFAIFNELFQKDFRLGQKVTNFLVVKRRRKLSEFSRQELIFLTQPWMCLVDVLLLGVCFIANPDMPLMVYSAIPTSAQTGITFFVLLIQEVIPVVSLTTTSIFTIGMEIMFCIKVNSTLGNQVTLLRSRLKQNQMSRLRYFLCHLGRNMEILKNELLIATEKVGFSKKNEKIMKRYIISIPNIRIQGGFIKFDRKSSLCFVDFVTKSLAAVLITF